MILSKKNNFFVFIILWLFHLNVFASKAPSVIGFEPLLTKSFWLEANVTRHKVAAGENLFLLLKRTGLKPDAISEAIKAKTQVLPKKYQLKVNDNYLVVNHPPLKAFVLYDHYLENSYVFLSHPQQTIVSQVELPYQVKVTHVEGRIHGSLIESITRQSVDEKLAYRFLDAYALYLNPMKRKLRDLKRGDHFSLTYEKLFLGKNFIRDGEVLQTSLELNGKKLERQFINFDDGGVFVDTHNLTPNKQFYAPVSYLKISSPFNRKRFHPIKKRRQPHLGIDFELPPGAPIFSAQQGVLAKIGKSRAGGHYVRIDHQNGYVSFYNHMRKINPKISEGLIIEPGATLGEAGCTGYCTKPHLHFGIKMNGVFVDPAPMLRPYPYQYEEDLSRRVATSSPPVH